MSEGTELQVSQPARIERSSQFSFAPTSFKEAVEFSNLIASTGMVPKAFQGKPNDILVAMQLGSEVGLPPMQALKSIAVINGMPSLYGDGFLAVVMGHPSFEWIKEDDLTTIEKNLGATCTIKRRGMEPHSVTFTYAMAATAGLLTKDGPWKQYKPRQCQMRARGFCGRNTFPDALRGISIFEEALDTPGTIDARDYPQQHGAVEEQSQVVDDHEIGADGAMGFWAFAKEHRRHKDTVLAFLKANDISDTRKILASKLEDLKQKLLKDTQPVAAVAAAPSPTSPDPGENMDAEPA